jgi:diguanylate cyclase (GGDEF)-like protein/putative nucleotidyltransferase with HDIG domain/PAS domain S-box-containing protein
LAAPSAEAAPAFVGAVRLGLGAPALAEMPSLNVHPSDSSRTLLGLMALSHRARSSGASENQMLEGVVDGGVLRSLLSALHFRDAATVRHARRTASLATALASFLGWDGRPLKVLEVAALLHDIGKIGVPDTILFKPTKLSPDESELMVIHGNIALDVLQACRVDQEVVEFVSHTHGYFQSTGDGHVKGGTVPIGARIIAVADAYDSLRSAHIYREGKPHAEAMARLSQRAGTQYDGNIISALSRWHEEKGKTQYQPGQFDPTAATGIANPVEALEASTLCHIFNYLYILESLYDGFYLLDSDLHAVVWNRGMESLLGYSAQQMLNQPWAGRELGYADADSKPLPDTHLPLRRVLMTGRAVTTLAKVKHADGNWKDVEIQTVPLLDSGRHLYGIAEIVRDLARAGKKPQEFRELRMAATRDALTSVANRGELETQLKLYFRELLKSNNTTSFCVIFVDVDHFKSVNDTFGHATGDKVLIELARLMQHEMYSGELVGRYGGEEFVILCPDSDLSTAFNRAERLRNAVMRMVLPELKGRQLTVSQGVAQYVVSDTTESLLHRADLALFQAKHRGRNQTLSLTPEQLQGAEKPPEPVEKSDPFLFTSRFHAVVGSGMVIYKLGGFVTDRGARLLKITEDQICMHMGTVSLFRYWGSDERSQPVEMEIKIGKPADDHNNRAASVKVEIDVTVRPLGKILKSEIFQERSKKLFHELRAYFFAEFS